jgi:hypothetical protein
MKYQIEAPSGIWTHKTVLKPLSKGRYLTVKLTQPNLQTPIVIELAELRSLKLSFNNYLPVAFSDIEVIDHRGQKKI